MREIPDEIPLNREPPVSDLIQSFITEHGAYDRNHGPIPRINPTSHMLSIDGLVSYPLTLTAEQLKSSFAQTEVVAALQCAGNRRNTMRTLLKDVEGIDWGDGAVMNCVWRGVKLCEVLQTAGVELSEGHVAFSCTSIPVQNSNWYGASIDLRRAMDEKADVLIALEMNGKALSAEHGFPMRIVAPGLAGCRSVKWLDKITVQQEESQNFYQMYDYKILPPIATNARIAARFWDKAPSLQGMPINSVIAWPRTGQHVHLPSSGILSVCGYALPEADDGPVTLVEVSIDEGLIWCAAEIIAGGSSGSKWSWTLWKLRLRPKAQLFSSILSRASDAGGNQQNGRAGWNLRGVAYNGYGLARDLSFS